MVESTEVVPNRRQYARVDAYIPLEYRLVNEKEHRLVKSRMSGEVTLANFNLISPVENHPQMECLNLLNKKIDTIIQMMALQCERFHSLPFKFVSLSGNGMKFSSRQYFSLGDVLEFNMTLTPYQPAAIYVYGEVIRVGRQTNGYCINVRFTAIDDVIRDKIVRFIFETEREMLRERRRGE